MKRIVKISILMALTALLLMACGKSKDDGAGVVYAPGQQIGDGSEGGSAGVGEASTESTASGKRPSGAGADTSFDALGDGDFSEDAAAQEASDGGDDSDEGESHGSGDPADAGRSKEGFSEQTAGSGDMTGADESDAADTADGIDGGSGLEASDGASPGEVTGGPAPDSEAGSEDGLEGSVPDQEALDENGVYTSLADVSLYLYTYEKLPVNFITKKQARSLGWSGGGLDPYANGFCIGGDVFGNYEGLLPQKKGRVYHECDIDTLHQKSRGAKRIVYSDDGLIYYTDDHYDSFTLIYEGWASSQAE